MAIELSQDEDQEDPPFRRDDLKEEDPRHEDSPIERETTMMDLAKSQPHSKEVKPPTYKSQMEDQGAHSKFKRVPKYGCIMLKVLHSLKDGMLFSQDTKLLNKDPPTMGEKGIKKEA